MQVALGLLQFLHSVGAGASEAAGPTISLSSRGPAGLNAMLDHCGLPPNPLKKAIHSRMDNTPNLFTRRPLAPELVQYAGAGEERRAACYLDSLPTMVLRTCLSCFTGMLCPCCCPLTLCWHGLPPLLPQRRMWRSCCQPRRCWRAGWAPQLRSACCASAAPMGSGAAAAGGEEGSYASAVRLLLGQDLALSIGPPGYRPRFSPLLPAGGSAGAEAEPGGGGPSSGGGSRAGQGAVANGTGQPAALDAESQLVLQLFPPRVQEAIAQVLARLQKGGEAGAVQEAVSGSGEAIARPSRQAVRLVEVLVDTGKPVRVRLSDRSEHWLEEALSVEVRGWDGMAGGAMALRAGIWLVTSEACSLLWLFAFQQGSHESHSLAPTCPTAGGAVAAGRRQGASAPGCR